MRFIVLIIIVSVAVVAGFAMLLLSNGQQPSVPVEQPRSMDTAPAETSQVATVDVLVARTDIPIGTSVTEALIDRQPWPRHLVLEGFVTSESKDMNIVGMVTRADFKAREPLILTKLARRDESSFLAASLPKGGRAITLAVDPISGVAGFVFPGDRVDVILTHNVPQEAAALFGEGGGVGVSKPTTAEVLLSNLKVLAINTRSATPEGDQQNKSQPVLPPSNITLEMSQEEAKKIRLAEKNGTLSLALRSIDDKDDLNVGLPVTVLDISRVEGGLGDSKGWGWRRPGGMSRQGNAAGEDSVVIVRGVVAEGPSPASAAPAAPMPDIAPSPFIGQPR